MPKVFARRPYEDDKPGGYLEGFRDYVNNNAPAVEWFLEHHKQIAYLTSSPFTRLYEALKKAFHKQTKKIEKLEQRIKELEEIELDLRRALESYTK